MRVKNQTVTQLTVLLILVLTAACTPAAASTSPTSIEAGEQNMATTTQVCPEGLSSDGSCNTVTPEPSATHTPTPPPPSIPTFPYPSNSATSMPLLASPSACPPDLCIFTSQYFLTRPIAPPGNDVIDATYSFGSTQSGQRDPHHGVEFLNGYGAPVQAAADGVVVVAGDDAQPTSEQGAWPITFYGPFSYFYGNLVVIEHQAPAALLETFPNLPQPIYTLYGHLSEISVNAGQQVQAGQVIGKVGMSGVAEGSHLHFEVRLGENTYANARNPELWLAPHSDEKDQLMGGIAGRFIDAYGNNLEVSSIVLQHLPDGPDGPSDLEITLLTYEEKALLGQTPFVEGFAVGDLPSGWYRISFPSNGLQQHLLEVFPGQLTVFTFRQE